MIPSVLFIDISGIYRCGPTWLSVKIHSGSTSTFDNDHYLKRIVVLFLSLPSCTANPGAPLPWLSADRGLLVVSG